MKQKKQKTENNSTPKENESTIFHKQKKDKLFRYLQKDPAVTVKVKINLCSWLQYFPLVWFISLYKVHCRS